MDRGLLNRLRDDPTSLAIGISTSLGNHNHMAMGLAAAAGGIDPSELKTVVFDAGSKTTNALLSGDVDVVPAPARSFDKLVEAGEVKGIAVATQERLQAPHDDVPTWAEVGLEDDATFVNWRGLAAPEGLTDEQIAYWDETLRELVNSPEWEEALAENGFGEGYVPHDEFVGWIDEQEASYERTLSDLGVT